jgi:DNA topoisomerase-3
MASRTARGKAAKDTTEAKAASGAGSAARSRSSRRASVEESLAGRSPGLLRLIIAEKPSVARDIAQALGRRGEKMAARNDFIEGERHFVTWAIGHLLELCDPEDYVPAYKRWRLEDLPIVPDPFRLKPISKTRSHLNVVLALLRSPVFGEVVNACDAGREGELIFRHLLQTAGVPDLRISRLWISAMTTEAILEGLDNVGDGRDYEGLEAAARCRNESDWLVGINATRGMTRKCGLLLSVGRVQTPTLALLAEREKHIQSFVPEAYWEVRACFQSVNEGYPGIWFGPGAADGRLTDGKTAEDLALRVAGRTGVVASVTRRRRNQTPPLLYDLTQLQRDMNRRHALTASRTLRLAQDLYEKYKVITYPRTDSRFLSGKTIPLLLPALRAVARVSSGLGEAAAPLLEAGRLPITGRLINEAKVRDHHAIIPTAQAAGAVKLRGDHAKVFEAVARRFIAAFYPQAVIEDTTVITSVEAETFRSRGRVVIEPGWLRVEDARWLTAGSGGEEEDAAVDLPFLETGTSVVAASATAVEKETRPPPRYTEASLLQVMETAGKLLEDEELQEAMKERGIGTPATRAAIIERLIDVGYLDRDRRTLSATPKGIELIDILPSRDLVSPVLTGLWEARLRQVEAGLLAREDFMAQIRDFVGRTVEEIRGLQTGDIAERMRRIVGKCSKCGSPVIEGFKAYSCSARKESGCDFYIWKVIAGRSLRPSEAEQLLAEGKTPLLRGFRSRSGGRFPAYLTLTPEGVKFVFPERKTPKPGTARRSATKA